MAINCIVYLKKRFHCAKRSFFESRKEHVEIWEQEIGIVTWSMGGGVTSPEKQLINSKKRKDFDVLSHSLDKQEDFRTENPD